MKLVFCQMLNISINESVDDDDLLKNVIIKLLKISTSTNVFSTKDRIRRLMYSLRLKRLREENFLSSASRERIDVIFLE